MTISLFSCSLFKYLKKNLIIKYIEIITAKTDDLKKNKSKRTLPYSSVTREVKTVIRSIIK